MIVEKHGRSTKNLVEAAVPGWLDTALEFMDFRLYSLGAALVLHEIFLPEPSTAMALILTMGTYDTGYVARIVGALIFGKMDDRIGCKKVLFITITMMGICTTLVSVLPTHAQIGVSVPILLVTLHIIQGLGAGVKISGAGTMLAEYAPEGERGTISPFVVMGTNCGTLSVTAIWAFMFFTLSKEELLVRGWRIPFLASVVIMVFAIWLRMNLKENPVLEKANDSNQPTAKPTPAGGMFQNKSFWLATGLRLGQVGNSGLIQAFLAGYLMRTLLFSKAIPTDALMISSILGSMTIPFLGWLSNKIGRWIPYIIMNASAIVLAWPTFSVIVDKNYAPGTITVALIVIHDCAVLGLFVLENITMTEVPGCKNRFIWMTIFKEIGGLTASGFGPILVGIFYTITESWYPVATMIMAYSVIGLTFALKMPEMKGRDSNALENAAEGQPRVVRAVRPSGSL